MSEFEAVFRTAAGLRATALAAGLLTLSSCAAIDGALNGDARRAGTQDDYAHLASVIDQAGSQILTSRTFRATQSASTGALNWSVSPAAVSGGVIAMSNGYRWSAIAANLFDDRQGDLVLTNVRVAFDIPRVDLWSHANGLIGVAVDIDQNGAADVLAVAPTPDRVEIVSTPEGEEVVRCGTDALSSTPGPGDASGRARIDLVVAIGQTANAASSLVYAIAACADPSGATAGAAGGGGPAGPISIAPPNCEAGGFGGDVAQPSTTGAVIPGSGGVQPCYVVPDGSGCVPHTFRTGPWPRLRRDWPGVPPVPESYVGVDPDPLQPLPEELRRPTDEPDQEDDLAPDAGDELPDGEDDAEAETGENLDAPRPAGETGAGLDPPTPGVTIGGGASNDPRCAEPAREDLYLIFDADFCRGDSPIACLTRLFDPVYGATDGVCRTEPGPDDAPTQCGQVDPYEEQVQCERPPSNPVGFTPAPGCETSAGIERLFGQGGGGAAGGYAVDLLGPVAWARCIAGQGFAGQCPSEPPENEQPAQWRPGDPLPR